MKAKKIFTESSSKPQAPDTARPARPTARQVNQTLGSITTGLEVLSHCDGSKTQLQAAISALFAVTDTAKKALLSLTGAPGIIWQSDLEEVCEARGDLGGGSGRADFIYLRDKLIEKFEAGYIVEGGVYYLKRTPRGGSAFGCCSLFQPPARIQYRTLAAPAPRQPDTPTSAQLQAWFDLPSDRPPAASSPAAS